VSVSRRQKTVVNGAREPVQAEAPTKKLSVGDFI